MVEAPAFAGTGARFATRALPAGFGARAAVAHAARARAPAAGCPAAAVRWWAATVTRSHLDGATTAGGEQPERESDRCTDPPVGCVHRENLPRSAFLPPPRNAPASAGDADFESRHPREFPDLSYGHQGHVVRSCARCVRARGGLRPVLRLQQARRTGPSQSGPIVHGSEPTVRANQRGYERADARARAASRRDRWLHR